MNDIFTYKTLKDTIKNKVNTQLFLYTNIYTLKHIDRFAQHENLLEKKNDT